MLVQRIPLFIYSIFNVRYETGGNNRIPLSILFTTVQFFGLLCLQSVPFNFFEVPFSKLRSKAQYPNF